MISYEHLYQYSVYLIYILYTVTLLGVWNEAPHYLNAVEYFFQLFVGGLLVWLNNPFTKHKYRPIDKKIAFSAGIFLLTTTTLSSFIKRLQDPLQKQLNNSGHF